MDFYGNITHCLTIGRRPDLLTQTLDSLTSLPKLKTIAINDFGDEETNAAFRKKVPDGRLIVNQVQQGHHPAIDKLYSAVETDYIFHNEDDWNFSRTDFLDQAVDLLNSDEKISSVILRDPHDIWALEGKENQFHLHVNNGIEYHRLDHLHEEWYSFGFNPHLVRRSLWQELGGYSQFRKERHVSRHLKAQGYYCAYLSPPVCEHIGWGRSNTAEPVNPFKKIKTWLRSKL